MFKVLSKLELAVGVVILSKEQAALRSHNLKKLDGDRYEILRPVQFKVGEDIGYEGDLPKALASKIQDARELLVEQLAEFGITPAKNAKVTTLEKQLKEAKEAKEAQVAKEAQEAKEANEQQEAADLEAVKKQLLDLKVTFAEDANLETLQTLLAASKAG